MALLIAIDAAGDDITAVMQSSRSFSCCIAGDDIRCEVDANIWSDKQEQFTEMMSSILYVHINS